MKAQLRSTSIVAAFGVLGLLLVGPANAGAAETVTFYEDVLPIFQDNCQTCHRQAGQNIAGIIAPMSLMTYEETRPWARAVARKVETHEMPPWYAEAPTGVFSNERGLTDAEIETIVAWVNAGAPAGDKAAAPPPRLFGEEDDGWLLGTPDFVVKMERYLIPDDTYDLQTTFRTKIDDALLPDGGVWVRGWEFRAGDTGDRVHHYCAGIEDEDTVVDADAGGKAKTKARRPPGAAPWAASQPGPRRNCCQTAGGCSSRPGRRHGTACTTTKSRAPGRRSTTRPSLGST